MIKKRMVILIASLLLMLVVVPGALAKEPTISRPLREAVTVDGILEHEEALQEIADANGGTRSSGTPGYDASADYIVEVLAGLSNKEGAAYYTVTVQEFDYRFFEELSSAFSQQSPVEREFPATDFDVMTYSGTGAIADVPVAAVNDLIIPFPPAPNTSNAGCEPEDFLDDEGNSLVDGHVALVQRGSCGFVQKAQNAEDAGAVGVLVFNEGQPDFGRDGVVFGTLGAESTVTIPTFGISYALGVELAEATDARVSMSAEATDEVRSTSNVLAETNVGRTDRVVLVGAHLDSVPEGPGINDNGSGSAAILEIASEMAELNLRPRNRVRFAWWGAEEANLVGSTYYRDNLTEEEGANIALNLNFDMVASPNFVRFVYDGDGSDTPVEGPPGSDLIEQIFLDYFEAMGLATEPTAFDGRSDYGPFIAVGIPAGGLFTGAEGIKTEEQAEIYGGTAGIPYDPCYHQACDTIDNVNTEALDQMSDATAHAVIYFAMLRERDKNTDRVGVDTDKLERKGPRYVK